MYIIIIFRTHQQKATDMKIDKERVTPATVNSLFRHSCFGKRLHSPAEWI